ncbi:hypothetical protein B484DRAFT_447021 [Ochromonadaceae sp. CCMP2298]|nr:hypothetical protein B484DRAFT_447021 [Ochromonadaceae sp. CCMP2298]
MNPMSYLVCSPHNGWRVVGGEKLGQGGAVSRIHQGLESEKLAKIALAGPPGERLKRGWVQAAPARRLLVLHVNILEDLCISDREGRGGDQPLDPADRVLVQEIDSAGTGHHSLLILGAIDQFIEQPGLQTHQSGECDRGAASRGDRVRQPEHLLRRQRRRVESRPRAFQGHLSAVWRGHCAGLLSCVGW